MVEQYTNRSHWSSHGLFFNRQCSSGLLILLVALKETRQALIIIQTCHPPRRDRKRATFVVCDTKFNPSSGILRRVRVLRSNHNFQSPQDIKRFREPESDSDLSLRSSTSPNSLIVSCWQTASSASTPQHGIDSASPPPSNRTSEFVRDATSAKDDNVQILENECTISYNEDRQDFLDPLVFVGDLQDGGASLDVWTAALYQAIRELDKDVDLAVLQGANVQHLFEELDEKNKNVAQESTVMRGVRYLSHVKGPLEQFKGILDLVSPIIALEPTVATVFGVTRGVTAVSLDSPHYDYDSRLSSSVSQA